MKLLLVSPYPTPNNGISDYSASYRAELCARGHSIDVERINFWRAPWDSFRWITLKSRAKSRYDAVIIQHTATVSGPLLPLFLFIARRAKIKTVVVGHEPPSVYRRYLRFPLQNLYSSYERAVFTAPNVAIVHTFQHQRELVAVGVNREISIIPIPLMGPAPRFTDRVLGGDWGFFGMISPKKGLQLLLDAYQERKPGHFPKLRVIGGAATGHEKYFDQVKASVRPEFQEWIEFQGFVKAEDLPAEFDRISMFIFPYAWISQSAALSYACRYHIPYLASDLPYFREFSERFGCGRLFASGSKYALIEALEEVAQKRIEPIAEEFDALTSELSLSTCTDMLLKTIFP